MILNLTNIDKSYGEQKVLENIHLTISGGEIVSFLGPNGAGKSTCIKIITGGVTPDRGNISIAGFDIANDPIQAKQQLGYLAENNPLYPELYVAEYLYRVAEIYHVSSPKEKIKEIAAKVQLNEVLSKKIGILSKGYKQRVGLAQALLHDPSLLILDEPFNGFDPNQLKEIYDLIKDLSKEKAILFSTHSLPEAVELSTRVVIIHKGMIRMDAPTKELIQKGESLDKLFKELTQ